MTDNKGKSRSDICYSSLMTYGVAIVGVWTLLSEGIEYRSGELLRRSVLLEWYRVRPNLVDVLRNPGASALGLSHTQYEAVVEAATFEARQRRAPEIQFEHLMLALLADGTDTSDLLDYLGIDRSRLAADIDSGLPTFDSGPYFPELARNARAIDITLAVTGKSSDLKVLEGALEWRQLLKSPERHPALDLLIERGLTLGAVKSRLNDLGVRTSDV